MAKISLGRIRKQPPGPVLQSHSGRSASAPNRSQRMAAYCCRHCQCTSRLTAMSFLSFLTSLCRNIIAKGRVERDLNDELSSYIELATKFKMKSGLSEPEARRAVLLEMEGAEQVKERVRETRTGYRIEMFLQDLRFAFRSLRKSPVFALTV